MSTNLLLEVIVILHLAYVVAAIASFPASQ